MASNKVARRYAKSLLLLAQERNELEQVKDEMQALHRVIGENQDLKIMLRSPVVKKDKKINVLGLIFKESIGPLVSGFIKIITNNNREYLLYEISIAFVELYNEVNKVISAKVTSAVALDDDLRKRIKSVIATIEHNEIQIEESINKNLIGGFVLRVDDNQIDASIARQLRILKNELITEEYSSKL
ncbi:MAG: ATP synthase F1 subunit delta [Crocinitomicaceae bacterium]|nr:ATP synthase F1 subunit delta [Crocinitomicaceae bacterium]|tara:strand:- start:5746 stop:6303 length:558 start_codon:yes stop_codon:yes gene_type:complete